MTLAEYIETRIDEIKLKLTETTGAQESLKTALLQFAEYNQAVGAITAFEMLRADLAAAEETHEV